MGVTGLWPILHPCARPTPLPTLNRKRLAVDASIWIYQFLKAVRDKEGNALRNSHVVGFFRRICKLLFFGIKPVFVFDGGAPILKRQTILGRKRRREGRRDDAARTAGKLLAVQMQRRGEEESEKRNKQREREKDGLRPLAEDDEAVQEGQEIVYAQELGMNEQQRTQGRKFRKTDAYYLPEMGSGIEGMGQPNDPRIMSAEELEDYARQFQNGEDVNLYDFSKIDFNGDFFMSLPAVDRYNILNAARLRSRLRMGLSKDQLEEMFPDRMAFSRFQIERVRERNELTQRLMNLNGMNDANTMFGVGTQRIAGDREREYVLVRNEGVEGGWALGVVSADKTVGERSKPIDIDALHEKAKENEKTESEDEFEDVPVEGLNRLPKVKSSQRQRQNMTYEDFQAKELADQRRKLYAQRDGSTQPIREDSGQLDALFVDDDGPSNSRNDLFDEEEDDINRAIALSLQKDPELEEELSETEHLNRAIALSLQKNHGQESENDDNADFENIPMPEYKQVAVPGSKPLIASSGKMAAHIINNKANASIPKKRAATADSDSDSDSDMDFHASLAKARRQKIPEVKQRQPMLVVENKRNPFDGPLPFEKLDFQSSIFGKMAKAPKKVHASLEESEIVDDEGGGFEIDPEEKSKEKAKPVPPWFAGTGDIQTEITDQKKLDREINAEDREMAMEEERRYRQKNVLIEIESSDEGGSDFEIVERPSPVKTKTPPPETFEKPAENVRGEPLVTGVPDARQLAPVSKSLNDMLSPTTSGEVGKQEDVWSESDYGGAKTKLINVAPVSVDVLGSELLETKSPSPEFEDVEMANLNGESATRRKIPSPVSEHFPMESPTITAAVPALQLQDSFDRAPAEDFDDSFDEFSDPDDEELLAQLAIEAESHAAFASTLNSKTPAENQASYEAELKSLRNQQKKDRRDADEVTMTMVSECQALLGLFGLPYITAPMEAEAQCAELVRLGLVDGVVTDDCDIFLFGGTRVYKNLFNSNKYVECYLQNDIENELSLGRDQLIAIAQLLGSDYTEGLPGVGPVTALEILSEFPTPSTGLEDFRNWWAQVQTHHPPPANEEPSKFRKKFRRAQSTKLFLPAAFPSSAVTEAYLKPDVDSTPEPFQWGVPDLDRLRDFLMATIGWNQERTDEVLVPVIRDLNRREAEGTQSNITRYFDGVVGAGAKALGQETNGGGSKRMKEAVSKLRGKKKSAASGIAAMPTFAKQAGEWARNNDLVYDEEKDRERLEKKKKAKGKRKQKAATPAAAIEMANGEDAVLDEGMDAQAGDGNEDIAEADDKSETADEDEYRETTKRKGKRKAKGWQPSRKTVKV
ncbi:DNA excision repair protein-like protein [Amylocarpus encephaloides]|uniref:DNA excision repair protein-like protein n=1 Tax=Amylocarpus encephaloides TaxID=45428 RepID=A0A9P7YPM3_9HELO|nr:DNA excision repair protein-like protein [Amylocarpus encephaloides]